MNKLKLLLISLGLLFILWLISWFGLFSLIGSSENISREVLTQTPSETKVDLSEINPQVAIHIDFGNGMVISDKLVLDENTTAYSILLKIAEENNLEVKTKQYDFGVFVEAIDKLESNKDKAWIYFVNGKPGQVAADKYELKNGDLVEWKYIRPSN